MSNPTLKIKVLPRFPSSVTVTSPLMLDTTGGNYTFGFNANALPTNAGGSNTQVQYNSSGILAGNAGLTYTPGNALAITPTAGTDNAAMVISQSTPGAGSVAGPIHLNSITVIDGAQTVTGSGDDSFGQITNRTDGLQVNYRVTGGTANHFGINSQMDVTATNGGTIALNGGIRINSGTTITGDSWGIIGFIKVAAGSTLNQTGVGIESEVGVASTGAIRDRIGFSSVSYGAVAGSGIDAAYTVSVDNEGGAYAGTIPFSNGLYFSSNLYSAATFPVASSGSLFLGDTGTVTNLLQFPTLTITGNFVSTPHITWAGAGNLQINKTSAAISSNAAVFNTTIADFVNVDTSPARLATRAFGAGVGAPSYIGYSAGGTANAPTKTLSGDSLFYVAGYGYNQAGTTYDTGGGVGILGIAAEDHDNTHGGTNLQLLTTPSGTRTQSVAGTLWSSQGLTVGSGGLTNPGTGVIRVSGGYQIGNSAPTTGHVLRSNGTSFVDAQLGFGDLSGSIAASQMPALTGDITTSAGAVATTLATVNANTGSWGSATQSPQITVNGKGLITAAANVTVTPAIGSVTGLGTGVAAALAINVGSVGAPVTNGGALGTPSSGTATNLTGTAAGLTAGTVTTNANLTGDVTSSGNATTLTNAPVIAKVLTGYTSGAGTVSAADSILAAIQKLNGNDALALPKTGGTMSGNITFSPSTAGLTGTATNDNAATGTVGEYVASTLTANAATNPVTITIASPAVVTWSTSFPYQGTGSYTAPIVFSTTGALPTGITAGTVYWVIGSTVNSGAGTFQIATSPANALAGTAINTSGTQSGTQTGTANVPLASGFGNPLTTAAIQLGVGDWDVEVIGYFPNAASTSFTGTSCSISGTNNTLDATLGKINTSVINATVFGGTGVSQVVPPYRLSLSSTTTVFLVQAAVFTVSTAAGAGKISARRVR